MDREVLFLVSVTVVVSGCVGVLGQSPVEGSVNVTETYFEYLENDRFDEAYGLLSSDVQSEVGLDEFRETLMQDKDQTERRGDVFIDGYTVIEESESEAVFFVRVNQTVLGGGSAGFEAPVDYTLEDGDWRIDSFFSPYGAVE